MDPPIPARRPGFAVTDPGPHDLRDLTGGTPSMHQPAGLFRSAQGVPIIRRERTCSRGSALTNQPIPLPLAKTVNPEELEERAGDGYQGDLRPPS